MKAEERNFWAEQLSMADDANYRLLCLLTHYVEFINREGLSEQFNEFFRSRQQYKIN
jgi:hypothetical protein